MEIYFINVIFPYKRATSTLKSFFSELFLQTIQLKIILVPKRHGMPPFATYGGLLLCGMNL